ncbi:type II secretion system protein [Zoogloea sp.]|uniref:type IV pilus modification PilV family protein n=1 Tax=Zoogloea sp. TaxID=49181 RepID=UPI0014166066|nr:MAG: type II secretion system protein [Zoogloea sp.]
MSALRARRQAGFSLLEVLVAFAIMAMSLVVLYRTSGGSVKAVADAELYDRAVRTARSVLAMQDGVPPAGLALDGEDAGMRWQLRTSPYPVPAANGPVVPLHRVEVVVFFGSDGARSISLAGLLPQFKAPPGGPQ